MPSLKRIVKEATGQDVSRCQACLDCEVSCPDDLDIPIGSLIQMVLFDDEEVLSSRTLWSDCVISKAHQACSRGIDISTVMQALREEAQRRGLSFRYL
jgi:heterodisulfide reductase subunit C